MYWDCRALFDHFAGRSRFTDTQGGDWRSGGRSHSVYFNSPIRGIAHLVVKNKPFFESVSCYIGRMKRYTHWISNFAPWIVALGLILSGVGAYFSFKLYQNLRTDIEELLPTTARSVTDLNEVTSRLESTDNLGILIFSQKPEASKRFVDALAAELRSIQDGSVGHVEYEINSELQFFNQRRPLFMELDELAQIETYIKKRIAYERELHNPVHIFSGVELSEPVLDFLGIEKKYASKVENYTRFPDGYYANPEKTIRVILVHLPGKLSGIGGATRLRETIDRAIEKVDPKKFSDEMEIRFTGGVQNLLEEHASLVADLGLSLVVVLVLVTLGLVYYFRSFKGPFVVLFSLLAGTFWTFGVSYFLVGYLNANSAFLGSIVIGNGINYGLILLARYVEERQREKSHLVSLDLALFRTLKATSIASLAAGLAYGSLMLTSFRGFSQFGVIGFVGMVFCWISAYTLLPALICLWNRRSPFISDRVAKKSAQRKRWITDFVVWAIHRHPHLIRNITAVLSVASLLMLTQVDRHIIEADLSKLRDKYSIEEGSHYLSRYVDEIFQRYLTPIVVLPKTKEDTQKISAHLKTKIDPFIGSENEEQIPLEQRTFIANVYSLDDFVPPRQTEKIQQLQKIKRLLPERMIQRLEGDEKKKVQELLQPSSFRTFSENDLPEMVLSKFRERDGTLGKLVLVDPPIGESLLDGKNLIHFVTHLREQVDSIRPGTAVAGQLPVSADMIQAISTDGPIATLFAFLAVVVLVVILFRRLRTIGLTLLALFLGVLWMVGWMLAIDLKINFLNFIALPITFGIGVDYGINIFQRYRHEGAGRILSTIRHTGGAVMLASYTTLVGYGSLMLAGNQAFVSFGKLSVISEITCIVAAIFSLPAYLRVKDKIRRRKSRTKRQKK